LKAYVVTTGSYSDYTIDSIFSTKEKAEAYKDLYSRSDEYDASDVNDIEEYEIDDPEKCWALKSQKISHYRIKLNLDFTIVSLKKFTVIQKQNNIPRIRETRKRKEFEIQCYAENINKAVKIAADILTQYLIETPGYKIKESHEV